MDSITERVRRGYGAFAAGDLDTLRGIFSPAIRYSVPGRGSLAGTYEGTEAVLGYFAELFTRSNGTFRAELLECGEIAPGVVAAHAHLTGTMRGGVVDSRVVQVFREDADGRVAEVSTYSEDQYGIDEADDRTPAGLVRSGYAAFAAADMDTLRELFHPDAVWHLPGNSALAGSYRGIDAILGLFGSLFERSGGSFRAALVGCTEVAPGIVTALAHDTAAMPDGALDQTNVIVFRLVDGKVAEATEHKADTYAYDAAVGVAITLPDARTAPSPQIRA